MVNKYYMYVLKCGDGSLYCGYTNHLYHRLNLHQNGQGAKYTRSHLPVKMIYYEHFTSKHQALSAEYHFKHQPRNHKIKYLRQHGVIIGD